MNGIVDCAGKQKTLQMSSGHKKHAWLEAVLLVP